MHLTPDELVDLAEGARPESSAPHLASCATCRAQLNEMRAMMSDAAGVDVPEPSPLFWDHLSQRVREAVANEPPPAPGWMNRLNVAWAAGVFGAVAVVVLGVFVPLHRGARQEDTSIPAAAASGVAQVSDTLPALQDDASWAVMGDLASQLNFEDAAAAGLRCRGVRALIVEGESDLHARRRLLLVLLLAARSAGGRGRRPLLAGRLAARLRLGGAARWNVGGARCPADAVVVDVDRRNLVER